MTFTKNESSREGSQQCFTVFIFDMFFLNRIMLTVFVAIATQYFTTAPTREKTNNSIVCQHDAHSRGFPEQSRDPPEPWSLTRSRNQ